MAHVDRGDQVPDVRRVEGAPEDAQALASAVRSHHAGNRTRWASHEPTRRPSVTFGHRERGNRPAIWDGCAHLPYGDGGNSLPRGRCRALPIVEECCHDRFSRSVPQRDRPRAAAHRHGGARALPGRGSRREGPRRHRGRRQTPPRTAASPARAPRPRTGSSGPTSASSSRSPAATPCPPPWSSSTSSRRATSASSTPSTSSTGARASSSPPTPRSGSARPSAGPSTRRRRSSASPAIARRASAPRCARCPATATSSTTRTPASTGSPRPRASTAPSATTTAAS